MIELILLACLVVLIVLIWKPVKKAVVGALDGRAEKIRNELDEAQRLHEEAKSLLAKYQRQLHEGEKLALVLGDPGHAPASGREDRRFPGPDPGPKRDRRGPAQAGVRPNLAAPV